MAKGQSPDRAQGDLIPSGYRDHHCRRGPCRRGFYGDGVPGAQ